MRDFYLKKIAQRIQSYSTLKLPCLAWVHRRILSLFPSFILIFF